MKYKLDAVIGFQTPGDGLTETEKALKGVIAQESVKILYSKLPTSRMKFIVAAHYELGYSQQMVADILGIKQSSLYDEIYHIRRVLKGNPYKPHKHKGTIKVEDLLSLCLLLRQP